MPLMIESHDDLPYIDKESSASELEAARTLLQASLDPASSTELHSSIDTSYEPRYSELILAAHDSIASSGRPRAQDAGVNLLRYEEPSAPIIDPGATSAQRRAQWSQTLKQAYTSHAYLSARQLNLSLLEKYGKNAWLIGNSQVEEELRVLEKELADVKRQAELLDEDRRRQQEGVRGELDGLEEAWRESIGRAIEAEVAAEGLRRDILKASRRAG